jgi:hypothetical protein
MALISAFMMEMEISQHWSPVTVEAAQELTITTHSEAHSG